MSSRRDFIKAAGAGIAGWVTAAAVAKANPAVSRKPNIIFILADDLGWA